MHTLVPVTTPTACILLHVRLGSTYSNSHVIPNRRRDVTGRDYFPLLHHGHAHLQPLVYLAFLVASRIPFGVNVGLNDTYSTSVF